MYSYLFLCCCFVVETSMIRFSISLFYPLLPKLVYNSRRQSSKITYAFKTDQVLYDFIAAAKRNDDSAAEQLVETPEFSDPDVLEGIDSLGNTPLILCAQRNWSDICKMLIDLNCNMNHQNLFGSTSLMCSAANGNLAALSTLLKCERTSIDLASRFGQTALMKAVIAGKSDSVDLLLKAGASVKIKNKQGKTALDLANEKGQIKIVNQLISFCSSSE